MSIGISFESNGYLAAVYGYDVIMGNAEVGKPQSRDCLTTRHSHQFPSREGNWRRGAVPREPGLSGGSATRTLCELVG